MLDSIPVTVVAGYLGSGKTTLLNRALRGDHGRKVAVIVNELGEIGLDDQLLEGGEGFLELDNGCLCCALNEDFVYTLGELGDREGLEQVFVETTGIADPLPIARAVERPELRGRFRMDTIATTVDVLSLERALEQGPEAALQIARADFAVLTKADLAEEAQIEAARRRIEEIAPGVRTLRADEAGAVALLMEPRVGAGARPRVRGQESDAGAHAHAHGHGYEALAVDFGERCTIRLCFEEFLEELPEGVYRSKGVVRIDGERGRLIFHTVAGRRSYDFREELGGTSRLVFIGRGFDRDALKSEVEALFEEAGA